MTRRSAWLHDGFFLPAPEMHPSKTKSCRPVVPMVRKQIYDEWRRLVRRERLRRILVACLVAILLALLLALLLAHCAY
jgi:hypothetical protein